MIGSAGKALTSEGMAVKDLVSTKEYIHHACHLYEHALDLEKRRRVVSVCSFSLEELGTYIGDSIRKLVLQTFETLDRIKDH